MIYEDHYGYQQRAERLQDYAPQVSRSTALMQARFEAHGLGKPLPAPPSSASEPDATAAPASDGFTNTTHQPSQS